MIYDFVSQVLIHMYDGLGIATSDEAVPRGFCLQLEILIVIDFAVVYDLDGPVFVAKRLSPSLQIDNTQSPMGQSDRSRDKLAGLVGSTMAEQVPHLSKKLAVNGAGILMMEQSNDTAHNSFQSGLCNSWQLFPRDQNAR
jgi:hypothetical protein